MGLRGTNSACWGWYLGQGRLILFIVTTNLKLPTQKPDLSQLCKRNSTLFAITQLENQWWWVNHLSPTFALETTYQNWWYDQIDPIAWNAGHTLVASCVWHLRWPPYTMTARPACHNRLILRGLRKMIMCCEEGGVSKVFFLCAQPVVHWGPCIRWRFQRWLFDPFDIYLL